MCNGLHRAWTTQTVVIAGACIRFALENGECDRSKVLVDKYGMRAVDEVTLHMFDVCFLICVMFSTYMFIFLLISLCGLLC